MSRYVFKLRVDNQLSLVAPIATAKVAAELFTLIDKDRDHLKPFLPWVQATQTVEDEFNFLKRVLQAQAEGETYMFLIEYDDQIVGTIDLHFVNTNHHRAEIGYWLASSHTGLGIMTRCVNTVTQYGFQTLDLNRIDIYCDVENVASNAVAKRSNYQFLATQPAQVFQDNRYRDMNQYVMLKRDFKED
ncbi:GNAT family N-acetyltransferase [Fundicoccus culcitae]|uniref:GNAT family N-acetyltransferase n=1 Tax=Fundicoccus culcitae TaxID=2969821 RepID=A0ABY5P4Z2_9LACT|nr:GNAT family protein [Fundicoccus culcitae]UUX33478.1 GNAT family N-acetyltransferase [Fundicoccus culcitae]